jgi:hypothetical protein
LIRLFIVPHTLVGLGFLAAALLVLVATALGHEETGHIEEASPVASRHTKSGTVYQQTVHYTYGHGAHQRQGVRNVTLEATEAPPGTDPRFVPGAPVRIWQPGPGDFQEAEMLIEGEGPWKNLLFVMPFAAFWCTIVGVFVYRLWIVPWLVWQTCLRGRALPGRVTARRPPEGRGAQHQVDVEFVDDETTRKETATASTEALWNQVTEGQAVTVLCLPGSPLPLLRPCVVYECADYDLSPPPLAAPAASLAARERQVRLAARPGRQVIDRGQQEVWPRLREPRGRDKGPRDGHHEHPGGPPSSHVDGAVADESGAPGVGAEGGEGGAHRAGRRLAIGRVSARDHGGKTPSEAERVEHPQRHPAGLVGADRERQIAEGVERAEDPGQERREIDRVGQVIVEERGDQGLDGGVRLGDPRRAGHERAGALADERLDDRGGQGSPPRGHQGMVAGADDIAAGIDQRAVEIEHQAGERSRVHVAHHQRLRLKNRVVPSPTRNISPRARKYP